MTVSQENNDLIMTQGKGNNDLVQYNGPFTHQEPVYKIFYKIDILFLVQAACVFNLTNQIHA